MQFQEQQLHAAQLAQRLFCNARGWSLQKALGSSFCHSSRHTSASYVHWFTLVNSKGKQHSVQLSLAVETSPPFVKKRVGRVGTKRTKNIYWQDSSNKPECINKEFIVVVIVITIK